VTLGTSPRAGEHGRDGRCVAHRPDDASSKPEMPSALGRGAWGARRWQPPG